MARVPIADTILISDAEGTVELVAGAKVELYDEATGLVLQDLFSANTGGTALQFVSTDAFGRYSFFVDPGRYLLKVSKANVIDRQETIQASDPSTASGGGGGFVDLTSVQSITGTKNFATITTTNFTVNGPSVLAGTVSTNDNIVTLNADVTSGSPSDDAGIEVLRGSAATAQLLWNEASDVWQVGTLGDMQSILRGTTSVFTSGSVLFAGATGAIDQNNANFFWDHTNSILKLGNGAIAALSPATAILTSGKAVALRGQDNNVDATDKATSLVLGHRTNAEEPVTLIYGQSQAANSIVNIGGGLNLLNAASRISFYTAANTTTVTGTERLRIDSSGLVTVFGGLLVQGTTTSVNTTNLEIVDKNILVNDGGTIVTAQTGAGLDVEGDGFIYNYLRLDSSGDWCVATTKGTGSGNATGLTKILTTGGSGVVTSVTGTANQVVVDTPTGDITLSLPQDIHSGASPTFATLNLNGNSNQIIFDADGAATGTLTWSPTTSNKTLTLPNVTDTLVARTTTDTLSNKTLTAPTIADFANAQHNHADATGGGQVNSNDLTGTILNSGIVTSSLTTVGALASGSIVSGFGNIDHGTNALSTGVVTLNRIRATKGTLPVSGDFSLSSGWGNTASVAVSSNSTDTRGTFTVTCSGTGITANPTVTFTFKDGTYTTAPFVLSKISGGSGLISDVTETTTATQVVFTYNDTPQDSLTYQFSYVVIG